MKIYRVGGSVRDEMLGQPNADRDFVVVGATPQEMIEQGFRRVGRDFPVFLHPQTHEEYALARTERKSGRGHQGFTFYAAPDVTLEADLKRRDLTINAMARSLDGTLIDPYGGESDLRSGVLRHVSAAFAEDPLRVLRVARFGARFPFELAPATEALMRAIAAGGELATLAPERVWKELARALMERRPSRFLAVLRRCGALAGLLPEVDALWGLAQPVDELPLLDAGVHLSHALDFAAARGDSLPVRYAVLAGGLGKTAETAPEQAAPGVRLAEQLSERLRVPADCRELAVIVARNRARVQRASELTPEVLLDLLMATDPLRRPERLEGLVRACAADVLSRPGRSEDEFEPGVFLASALGALRRVDGGSIAAADGDAGELPQRIRAARIAALVEWKRGAAVSPLAQRPSNS